MRISARKDDPGYLPFLEIRSRGKRPRVFLDGVERERVITADTEQRMILRYVTDEKGKMRITNDEIATETLYGDVRIEEKDYS